MQQSKYREVTAPICIPWMFKVQTTNGHKKKCYEVEKICLLINDTGMRLNLKNSTIYHKRNNPLTKAAR